MSVLLLLGLCSCPSPAPTPDPSVIEASFTPVEDRGIIENPRLAEASGLVASRQNPGFLWSHNDSGNGNILFLIDSKGKGVREFELKGVENRVWEDMAIVGESDGSSTIFVADFGDNNASLNSYAIFWCKEPQAGSSVSNVINAVQQIRFSLPDGARDMECLLVDQKSKDVYIVSKREMKKRLYRIAASNLVSGSRVIAEFVQELSISQPLTADAKFVTAAYITAGDISPDNTEILIKSYVDIFYWKRKVGESIPEALKRASKAVPYTIEPQGEGIAFAADGSGYYTISESDGNPVHLYFYKKK